MCRHAAHAALQRDQAVAEAEALQEARRTVEARRDFSASRERLNDLEKAALGLNSAAAALDSTGAVFDGDYPAICELDMLFATLQTT